MTLHFSHIGLTDGLTFMIITSSKAFGLIVPERAGQTGSVPCTRTLYIQKATYPYLR